MRDGLTAMTNAFRCFYPDTHNGLTSMRGQVLKAADANQGFSRSVTGHWEKDMVLALRGFAASQRASLGRGRCGSISAQIHAGSLGTRGYRAQSCCLPPRERRRRPRSRSFAARWLACAYPCRRFACTLAGTCARLGADAVRYSFIVADFHRLLLAGLTGALSCSFNFGHADDRLRHGS